MVALSESMAMKAAGSKTTSSLDAKVTDTINAQRKPLVPAKPTATTAVDKSNSRF